MGKAALDRVVELEGLEGLTEEQEVELAELQPKAQQWRQRRIGTGWERLLPIVLWSWRVWRG
ncbi:hypothetical protein [Saccharopolyspora spinosa]|uniref:hypothetical protein n=1 Tax=Saccharopolyspora spinosa TaxID=60894 RepID=UPI00376F0EDA